MEPGFASACFFPSGMRRLARSGNPRTKTSAEPMTLKYGSLGSQPRLPEPSAKALRNHVKHLFLHLLQSSTWGGLKNFGSKKKAAISNNSSVVFSKCLRQILSKSFDKKIMSSLAAGCKERMAKPLIQVDLKLWASSKGFALWTAAKKVISGTGYEPEPPKKKKKQQNGTAPSILKAEKKSKPPGTEPDACCIYHELVIQWQLIPIKIIIDAKWW